MCKETRSPTRGKKRSIARRLPRESARIRRRSFFRGCGDGPLRRRRSDAGQRTTVRSARILDPDSDDDDDDDDMEPDGVLKANAVNASRCGAVHATGIRASISTTALANSSRSDIFAIRRTEIRHSLGSNNWAKCRAITRQTGKPLLANDTHLELSIPPIWYEIHLTAPGWNVKGFDSFPARRLSSSGFQRHHIAWGFTNNGADVQDLYIETFTIRRMPDEYSVNKKMGEGANDRWGDGVKIGLMNIPSTSVITRHGPNRPVARMGKPARCAGRRPSPADCQTFTTGLARSAELG